jgi:hypothetical protein
MSCKTNDNIEIYIIKFPINYSCPIIRPSVILYLLIMLLFIYLFIYLFVVQVTVLPINRAISL